MSAQNNVRGRVMFLCHRIPYPPDKGDKIRSYHLLKYLAARFEVTLGCFIDDPEDMVYRDILADLCVDTQFIELLPRRSKVKSLSGLVRKQPLSLAFYSHPEMAAWVAEQRRHPGLSAEVAFSSSMAPYLQGAMVPTLIDMVDADSAKFRAYGEDGDLLSRLVYAREGRLLARAEADAVNAASKTFLVTPEEAAVVRSLPGVAQDKVDWCRNGVDTDYWRADATFERMADGFDVIFTGAMDYRPNIEAVTRFADDVWPLLQARHSGLSFGIVGARPTPAVQKLAARDGITVTGRVADMRPYLAAAKIAVAPLQIARGVQNKVLEALAMATPVVATRAAIIGTGAISGVHLLAADSPSEMVTEIASLLADPDRAFAIGETAAQFIRSECSWGQTLARFGDSLEHLCGTGRVC